MPLINWTPAYSVQVPEIDQQHQKLVQMINQLHDAMSSGQGRNALKSLLASLIQYTVTHFSFEEQLMQKANYPDLDQHRQQHELLKKQVHDMNARLQSGEMSLTIDVLNFLRDWLIKHIQGTDQKYVPYLAKTAAAASR